MPNALREAFFQWGWLLPAVLPVTQLGGRALFNSLAGGYALWGLWSFWSRRDRLDRAVTGLYLALLGVYLLELPGSDHPAEGLRSWGMFFMQSLTLPLTQLALQDAPPQSERLLKAMALFGATTLGGVLLLLPYHSFGWSGQPFDPNLQLQEDNLPFLLPFLLYWVWRRDQGRWRYGAMLGITAVILGYVALAEGRAALVGLIVGLATFCWMVLRWRLRWSALAALAVLLLGVIANIAPFHKGESDPNHPLDAFTSGRTILWRQALDHPPPRFWSGVGIGNGAYAHEVLRFEIGGEQVEVKHLHNFLLDAWYETGMLGLILLLALLGLVFGRLAWIWRDLALEDRERAGVLLAAALALASAGLLSFSYTSRYFACYFFVCLGGLSAVATVPKAVDTGQDKH